MLDFTWKVFSQTGNIDTYLLYKEIEKEMEDAPNIEKIEIPERDEPMTQS
ncbi:YqzL family protein [Fervidibacillus halotolerans]|uniref:YqzL family protein n=1 Tax=Fervidibacillus halotolerans TaxID=2980027 RepID=A0A9E8RW92_9BACI|nr:YqzL family protein [Fervidibacillus halotolerans]WAA11490.1 YqzL family protein [Fervidibacillus halotolerans]